MKFERIVLSLLTMLPWKAVAFAADSRLTSMEGEEALYDQSWSEILQQKDLLFEPNAITTTPEKAYQRFLRRSGLENHQKAQVEFAVLVDRMLQDGTIKTNERLFISEVPSRAGF